MALGPDPYRLPVSVLPTHYDLEIEPDLDRSSFAGRVAIRLDARAPLSEIVLNAKDLVLTEATLTGGDGAGFPISDIALDEETERATFALGREVGEGSYTLRVAFRGALNAKLAGFYRSTFTDPDGREQVIATTQFESTDARRAFPCFDEPAFKATFGITLVIPEHLTAFSNAPAQLEEPAGEGLKRVRFADTMRMSTYLVAFVIGPFQATPAVDAGGVPLRIIYPPGKGHLAGYALRAGEHALKFFSKYYGVPYPGHKLDMVAIPDFAFGAMENLGCITYREVLLLVDEAHATQAELLRVADVIAHEIAHMWFGDLVTMRWWNGIWLNEAFATFMATLCTDAFRPEWGRWDQFSRERSAAFDVDSLAATRPIEYEVLSPADADGMFDLLTYEKGASVLRMLEQYLGPDRFRDGIRHYLQRHAYGSTETGDLWDAIEEVVGEPVRRIMDSWIFQPGYPLISVSAGPKPSSVGLRQERFFYQRPPGTGEGEFSRWAVPMVLGTGASGGREERPHLLDGDQTLLELDREPLWVLANVGSYGFYRVRYAPELLGPLAEHMMTDLSAVERYSLVDDAWAAVTAGALGAGDFLELANRFEAETDLDVWAALIGGLASLERLLEGAPRQAYRRYLQGLLQPASSRLGWEPLVGEGPRSLELRALLFRALAVTAADPATLSRGRDLHDAYLANPSGVEPNLALAAAAAVASQGGVAEYDVFVERFRRAATPQEERRYRSLLAAFPGSEEMTRTLAMSLDGTIRTQDAPFLLAECLGNRDQGPLVWAFIRRHWGKMLQEYPDNSIVRMLSGVRALSRPETAASVFAFFLEHRVPKGQRTLEQHLEKLRINVALREREAQSLAKEVSANPSQTAVYGCRNPR